MPFLKDPNPIANCAPRCCAQDACLPCKLTKFRRFRRFRRFLACTTSRLPLESDNNHFLKWFFMKMVVSVVGGWESGLELVGSPLMLKNAWICFRTSFSWVGNNPSLQSHLFCENQRKSYQTRDPTDGLFFAVLLRQDLHIADSFIYKGMKFINTLCLSHLICYWCLAGKASPMRDTFLLNFSSNKDSVQKYCIYFVSCCLPADYCSW